MKARSAALSKLKTLIIYHNKILIQIEIIHAIAYLIIKSSNRVACYHKSGKFLIRHQRNKMNSRLYSKTHSLKLRTIWLTRTQCNTTSSLHSTPEEAPLARTSQGGGRRCSTLMTSATTRIRSWRSCARSGTTSSLRITSRRLALTRTSRTSRIRRRPRSSGMSLNYSTMIRTTSGRRATLTHLLSRSNSLRGRRDSVRDRNRNLKREPPKSDSLSMHSLGRQAWRPKRKKILDCHEGVSEMITNQSNLQKNHQGRGTKDPRNHLHMKKAYKGIPIESLSLMLSCLTWATNNSKHIISK